MSAHLKGTIRARVRITLDIMAGSHWGAETTMKQIHDQAIDDVEGFLRRGKIAIHRTTCGVDDETPVREAVVVDAKVTAIYAGEER